MMLSEDNLIVHGLWIGGSLSPIELLTIRSFQAHGHTFVLWTYDGISTPLPPGTVLRDANEVLDRVHVFSYRHTNEWGHGRGSFAGFSDIFRYKLLYEHGGWWVDMDITCLRPLNFEAPYVFRNHDLLQIVGNVMKCPPRSALMLACFERGIREVNAENKHWLKPVEILNEEAAHLGLTHYILHDITNRDQWPVVQEMMHSAPYIPHEWHAIHWMNEMWRINNISKNECFRRSYLAHLHHRHNTDGEVVWRRQGILTYVRRVLRKILHPAKMLIKRVISKLARMVGLYPQLKWAQNAYHHYRRNPELLRYDSLAKLRRYRWFRGIESVRWHISYYRKNPGLLRQSIAKRLSRRGQKEQL